VVVGGRRGRRPEPPRTPGPDEYGVEETEGVELAGGAGPGRPSA